MASTIVVGRVAIRVYPDTSYFRADLKSELVRMADVNAEVIVKPKLDESAKKQVQAELDAAFAEEKVKVALDVAQAKLVELRTKIQTFLADLRVKLLPTVNPSDVLTSTTRVRAMLAKGIDMYLNPEIRTASLEATKLRIESAFRSLKAKIVPNLDEMQAFRVLHNLKGKFDVKAKIKPDLVQRSVIDTWLALKLLLRPVAVKVKPFLDKVTTGKVVAQLAAAFKVLSGLRMGQNFFTDFFDKFKNLDKDIPKLMAWVPAIATVSAALLNLTGGAVSLIYSLGQIFPLVLALPSVLMGVAASGYVLYASFANLKKFMPDLAASFTGFKESIGTAFWNSALGNMRSFLKKFVPEFRKGMVGLSGETGKLVASIAGGFERYVLPVLGLFFDSWTAFTRNFATAGDAIGRLFATFIRIGADIFPRMGKAIADATGRLDAWFQLNTDNGKVMAWIDLAWTRLAELMHVLTGIVDVVAAVGRAIDSAGGPSLKSLGDTLQRWGEILSTPTQQMNIANFFSGANLAMDEFWAHSKGGAADFWGTFSTMVKTNLPALGAMFGDLLGSILDGVASPQFQKGFTDMVNGIGQAIKSLYPDFVRLVTALGPVGTLIGSLMTSLAPILGWVMDIIAAIVSKLSGPLGDMVSFITSAMAPILADLFAVLQDALDQIAPYLPIIGEALKGILTTLRPVLEGIFVAAGILLVGAVQLLAILVVGLREVVNGIATAINWLVTNVPIAAKAIGDWFTSMVDSVVTWGKSVGQAFQDGINAVFGEGGFFDTILKWCQGIIDAVKNFFGIHSPSTVFMEIGTFLVQGLIDGINAMIGNLGSTLGSLASGAIGIGTNLASQWVAGVVSMRDRAVAGLRSLADQGIAALNGLVPGAGTALAGFVSKIGSGVGDAMSVLSGIAGRVSGAVGSLGSILWSAGSSILQGLINGINARVNDVKGLLNWLTSKIPSWKGPYDKDKTLLTPAGEALMQSLVNGLKNGAGDVKNYLQDFTTELGKTKFEATMTANRNTIAGVIDAGVDGNSAASLNGKTVNVTNYYPQAEPTSRTVNRALELATLL